MLFIKCVNLHHFKNLKRGRVYPKFITKLLQSVVNWLSSRLYNDSEGAPSESICSTTCAESANICLDFPRFESYILDKVKSRTLDRGSRATERKNSASRPRAKNKTKAAVAAVASAAERHRGGRRRNLNIPRSAARCLSSMI
jgi:hypothetical protein